MFKPIRTASRLPLIRSRQTELRSRFAYFRNISASPRSRTLSNLPAVNRKTVTTTLGLLGGLAICQWASGMEVHAEAPPVNSAEDRKRKLSVQHIQVQNSLQNPGVYAWGNNAGRVVAPDSDETPIKSPRRLPFFDNVLLRDLKLDRNAGVAVTEKGDLLQWGTAYADGIKTPEVTLKGKNIVKAQLSRDRILALSKDGAVYSLPIAKKYQLPGTKPSEASWIPGLSSKGSIHYRALKPDLGYFESVTDIASGLDHVLLLTSQGRVFSAAASSSFPVKGQTGIQGLTYVTRPKDKPYDTCHEITGLNRQTITKIAAGDYHSLVCDSKGQVFSFGDNTSGQLGFDYDPENNTLPTPTPLSLKSQYPGKNLTAVVRALTAGGANSYFVVDVEDTQKGGVTPDLLACGTGIFGNLGNGRWTHVQGSPVKVKSLSGLSEYDERANKVIPIRPKYLSVSATHTAAVMDNLTKVDASSSPNSPVHDVNYGADVLWWGNNEHYQLGTGKRTNSCVPVYIPPLDPVPEDMAVDKSNGMTGSSTQGDLTRKSGIIDGKGDGVGGGMSMGKDQVHRFQITPRKKANIAGRTVEFEQRISCGRGNTAVYSAV
ncbi:hypothetical protein C7212DRAFT_367064 [Tuber magnatum]|uniref:RCC1/BLIP-II protein n=1 Tax=Tuber magnatum TaxID=42249 RepID=A0A317SBH9_9PEZI|nr:hypothetical protein C7212DRAFT_367064 [Tuber magnatum]